MKRKLSDEWENGRVEGKPGDGPYGSFAVHCPDTRAGLFVTVSDGRDWVESLLPGMAWEHASVSTKNRCPTWAEMHWVKRQLWDDGETVIQLHPPESGYINFHPFVLHLWKPVGVAIPLPPARCV